MAILSATAPGGLAALHAHATAGLQAAAARAEAAARQVVGAGAPPAPPAMRAGPPAAAPMGLLAAQPEGADPAAGLAMLLQARQAYAANAAVLRSEAAMAGELTGRRR